MVKSPRSFRWPGFLLVICLATGVTAPAAPAKGYLEALGPAPLRFRPPRPAFTPMLLPPLVPPETRKADAASQTTNALASLEPASTNKAALTSAAGSAATNALSNAAGSELTNAQSPAAPDAAIIDPRAVLGFLVPAATNSLPANVVLPPFVPPEPPRSSRAVYESR